MGSTVPGGNILVVCTGNICRSPYIERRLRAALDDSFVVESAGTGALVGYPIDPSSAAMLDRDGITSDDFLARDVSRDLLREADLVVLAEREHLGIVARLDPRVLRKGFALLDLAHLIRGARREDIMAAAGQTRAAKLAAEAIARRAEVSPLSPAESSLADPFRRELSAFESMAGSVSEALPVLVRALNDW
ncbi:MAG: hypothetical protein Q4G67_04415 [Actinomycetia bacterium]|nr:hypothetical protein [Actinomycetes bacterium]